MSCDRPRRDLAVILARGESRRMGTAKGLLVLKDGGAPFAAIIAGLYRPWADVVLVTRHEDRAQYAAALADLPELEILGLGPGGETALTLREGWRASRNGPGATHVWAHPVDMPLVPTATMRDLWDASRRRPSAVVRPVRDGSPGHPVVVPAGLLAELRDDDPWMERPFREFLAWRRSRPAAPEFLVLDGADAGTVRDFDRPEDLAGERKDDGDV